VHSPFLGKLPSTSRFNAPWYDRDSDISFGHSRVRCLLPIHHSDRGFRLSNPTPKQHNIDGGERGPSPCSHSCICGLVSLKVKCLTRLRLEVFLVLVAGLLCNNGEEKCTYIHYPLRYVFVFSGPIVLNCAWLKNFINPVIREQSLNINGWFNPPSNLQHKHGVSTQTGNQILKKITHFPLSLITSSTQCIRNKKP